MTKEEVIKSLEIAHEGAVIAKGLDSEVSADRARTERDNYGLKGLLETPFYADGRPRYTQAQYNVLTDQEKEQRINEGFQFRQGRGQADGIKGLASKLDEVTDEKGLLKIANVKQVIENVKDDERSLVESYAPIARYDQLIQDLSDPKKKVSAQDEEEMKKLASAAASRKQLDALKGYSESLRETGAKLAGYLPSDEVSRDELKAGAEDLRKRIAKNVEAKFGADYKIQVANAVRGAMSSLVKSGNPDKERLAANLYLKSEKGYEVGNQDFSTKYT